MSSPLETIKTLAPKYGRSNATWLFQRSQSSIFLSTIFLFGIFLSPIVLHILVVPHIPFPGLLRERLCRNLLKWAGRRLPRESVERLVEYDLEL